MINIKTIKQNLLSIVVIIALFIFTTFLCYSYKINTYHENFENRLGVMYCSVILKYEDLDLCKSQIERENVTKDTLTLFQNIIQDESLPYYLFNLSFIIIIAISIFNVHKEFRSLNIKNNLTRMDYKKYLKKVFLNSYSHSLIIPLLVLYVFIWAYSISGSFDYIGVTKGFYYSFPIEFLKIPFQFIICYILNLFFINIVYISIGLLVVKNNKNYIVSVIESCIIFLALVMFMSYVLPFMFGNKIYFYIDIFDMFSYFGRPSLSFFTIYCFILSIISILLVYFSYRNQEKTILILEKNKY